MGRLDRLYAPASDASQEYKRLVGLSLALGIGQNPLHDYAGVDHHPHGRPSPRALATSTADAGRCLFRLWSRASIATARRRCRCRSSTACCIRRAMTALLFSPANASLNARLISVGTLKLTVLVGMRSLLMLTSSTPAYQTRLCRDPRSSGRRFKGHSSAPLRSDQRLTAAFP